MCAKIPHDGRIKKDCVPAREAPGWYAHLLENRDFRVRGEGTSWSMTSTSSQGCNGGVCFCDDRDACNRTERSSTAE